MPGPVPFAEAVIVSECGRNRTAGGFGVGDVVNTAMQFNTFETRGGFLFLRLVLNWGGNPL
jgi:hypothetical protein